jgi:hypothetical protein
MYDMMEKNSFNFARFFMINTSRQFHSKSSRHWANLSRLNGGVFKILESFLNFPFELRLKFQKIFKTLSKTH